MLLIRIFVLQVLIADFAHAKITEISKLSPFYQEAYRSIEKYGSSETLLVFDLDNTLLTSTQVLGSYGWYKWQESMILNPKNDQTGLVVRNFEELLNLAGTLLSHGRMELTDPQLPVFLKKVRAKGASLLVLTARGPRYWFSTLRDLELNGLGKMFNHWPQRHYSFYEPILKESHEHTSFGFSDQEAKDYKLDQKRPVLFQKGVMFSSGLHKGAVLKLLLSKHQKRFKNIIYIDDSKKHCTRVSSVLGKEKDLNLQIYRFTMLDHKVAKFQDKEFKKQAINLWQEWQKTLASGQKKKIATFKNEFF